MAGNEQFHDRLNYKMDDYAHLVYSLTRKFPKEEIFGTTSQLRRSSLSVILNYTEGYARGNNTKSYQNFLDISFGSLKESQYLLKFCHDENFINKLDFDHASALADEIGAMLWGLIKSLKD